MTSGNGKGNEPTYKQEAQINAFLVRQRFEAGTSGRPDRNRITNKYSGSIYRTVNGDPSDLVLESSS